MRDNDRVLDENSKQLLLSLQRVRNSLMESRKFFVDCAPVCEPVCVFSKTFGKS